MNPMKTRSAAHVAAVNRNDGTAGTGEQTIILLQMNLDLATFFNENGYDSIINLAIAIGGANR